MIIDEQVLAGMDPNGAVMKYGDIVGHVAAGIGVAPNTIYGEVGQILQRMKRGGRVELVKGKGSGWRRVAGNGEPPVAERPASLGPSNDDSPAVELEMFAAEFLAGSEGRLADIWDVDGDAALDDSEQLPDAWAWDISRPLAEQLAETAADDAAADALAVQLLAEIDRDDASGSDGAA